MVVARVREERSTVGFGFGGRHGTSESDLSYERGCEPCTSQPLHTVIISLSSLADISMVICDLFSLS